ncbi:MAG: sensor histidine kinase [Alphaproteobacteria bacterium]
MQTFQQLKSLDYLFKAQVAANTRGDDLLAARHRAFISAHFYGGLLAALVFPLYLGFSREVAPTTAAAFIWLISPMAIAVFLARTGRLEAAHIASVVNLTALIIYVSVLSGGVSSFALAWLVVVPVEAALADSRRTIYLAILLTISAVAGLWVVQWMGAMPPSVALTAPLAFTAICISSAVFYVGALSMNIYALARCTQTAERASRQRYRLMAENATDLISVHDARGNTTFVSLGAQRLFNQRPEALMNDGFLNALQIGDRPAFLAAVEEAVANNIETRAEFRIRSSNDATNGYLWVELRCRPLKDAKFEDVGQVVAVTRDISGRKQREIELCAMRDAAEAANQAKTRFLANISHELRTPLNSIIGFSDILSTNCPTQDTEKQEQIQLINESGHHLLQVVNDLLDMSKIEAGRYEIVRESFSLAALIDACVRVIAPTASETRITIATDIAGDAESLNADRRATKQIVFNLLSNAVKFSHVDGSVTIGARAHGDTIEIFASDQGIGISQDDLKKLGRPFVQAQTGYNRNYEGTGLGLSVTSGFAKLHGGHMKIESELGVGTCIRVFIPLQNQSEAADKGSSEVFAVRAAG